MGMHKQKCKQYLINEQSKHFPRSMLLFDEFDIDVCKMELVEDYPKSSIKLLKCEGCYCKMRLRLGLWHIQHAKTLAGA